MKTVFLRAIDADVDDKASVLHKAIHVPSEALGTTRFEIDPKEFSAVANSPFAYWVSERLRKAFGELYPFEIDDRVVKQGLATADDFRFVRQWSEVAPDLLGETWFPIAKGGKFSPYYQDLNAVVNWKNNGSQIRNFVNSKTGKTYSRPQNIDYYFKSGLSWPLRGIRFSSQAVPKGSIFSIAGKMAFADPSDLPWLHAIFNSLAFDGFIAFFAGKVGGVQYEVGLIQKVPVPEPSVADRSALAALAKNAWSLRRALDTVSETSHAFSLPGILQAAGASLAERAANYTNHVSTKLSELGRIQAEIDDRCFALYGITAEDRQNIERSFGAGDVDEETESQKDDGDDEDDVQVSLEPMVASLLSWSFGVSLGRFDIRLVVGKCHKQEEPDPFALLPTCSPGMLSGDDGLPLDTPPKNYPLVFQMLGVLVDDIGHGQDLIGKVRAVFDLVFGDDSGERFEEAERYVGGSRESLRTWFGKYFFADHVKRYSKSRRKAPIYWQLATPSASYSVWCYYHRLNRDTFFRIEKDYITPKVDHEEQKLNKLRQEAGKAPSTEQRKAIATQESFVEELRALKAEISRIAPLWNPNLNDGVIINFAPLWRLVPQQKTWQKECKKVWDNLCKGDYDWAYLAMHLWPERVVPKCQDDRSLAIAHGLEDEFWYEDNDGKWCKRKVGVDKVQELIAKRASTAVKAALGDLLAAPTPGGGSKARKGRGKA